MIPRSRLLPFSSFILLWGIGCSSPSRVAGGPGNGSETESLSARILDTADQPLANALVRIRPGDFLPDTSNAPAPSGWTTVTDAAGLATFDGLASGDWRLEVLKENYGLVVSIHLQADTILPTLKTLPVAALSGSIVFPEDARCGWVRIPGTDHLAKVDSAGHWRLDRIPAGVYLVRADAGTTTASWPVTVTSGQSMDAGLLVLPGSSLTSSIHADSILLDDFEQGNGTQHAWGKLIGGGKWWVSDSGKWFNPLLTHNSIANGLVTIDAWNGRSLHVKRTSSNGWTTMGMEFDTPPGGDSTRAWHDLRSLDSIVFWAKGHGKLGVKITGKWEKAGIYYAANVDLDSIWHRYSIAAEAQTTSKVGASDWRAVADSSEGLAFVVNDTTEVWLDQIVLKGISPTKLWPRLRSPP